MTDPTPVHDRVLLDSRYEAHLRVSDLSKPRTAQLSFWVTTAITIPVFGTTTPVWQEAWGALKEQFR